MSGIRILARLDLYSKKARPHFLGPETFWYSTRELIDQARRIAREARRQGLTIAVSADLGPDLVGGVLTRVFGWEAIFFVNVPLAVIAVALAFRLIPRDAEPDRGRSLDLPGALTATLGLTLVVFVLVEGPSAGWGSTTVLISASGGVLSLALSAMIERRSRDPLLSAGLLANRNLAIATGIAFLFWATFGSALYFLTLYLQDVRGYDPLATGIGFLLPTAIVVIGSATAGRLATRFGLRRVLVVALSIGAPVRRRSASRCQWTAPIAR